MYMFKKNSTDVPSTVWPSVNFQPFVVTDTVVLFLLYTGRFPAESCGCRLALPANPNQYKGRYIICSNCEVLVTVHAEGG